MTPGSIWSSTTRFRGMYRLPAVALTMLALALPAHPNAPDEVTKWNITLNKAAVLWGLEINGPLHARLAALMHIAIHDALNGIDRRYAPYALRTPVSPASSPAATVATAAHAVLSDQFNRLIPFFVTPKQDVLDAAYASSLSFVPAGPAKTAGIALGKAAAQAILNLRASDGWDKHPILDFNYPQGTKPGEYRFTAPFTFTVFVHWGKVRPFALTHSGQFLPAPPYPINSKQYADDFNEIKAIGGDGVTTLSIRTADQTQVALFWLESSIVQWNRIARTVAAARGLDHWENARLLALLNIALADGYIATFGAKYRYNFWRPVTAIHEGDTDGNPNTIGDARWTPLAITPPLPDHDSGHSVEGGAAAEVLGLVLGDRVAFRTCSTTLPAGSNCNDASPVTRFYTSFSQAAQENGISRILVGFHFRRAVTEGIEHGRKIGRQTVTHVLRPVR